MSVICHKITVKCRWNHGENFTVTIYKLGPKCRWNILIVGDHTATRIIRVYMYLHFMYVFYLSISSIQNVYVTLETRIKTTNHTACSRFFLTNLSCRILEKKVHQCLKIVFTIHVCTSTNNHIQNLILYIFLGRYFFVVKCRWYVIKSP
jgi:hypothetical protein